LEMTRPLQAGGICWKNKGLPRLVSELALTACHFDVDGEARCCLSCVINSDMERSNGKKLVVVGLLGTTLDAREGPKRWDYWRPTVSLCQHEDLLVDRLVLLSDQKFMPLAKRTGEDISQVSPETNVQIQRLDFPDPWDFETVYAKLHDFAQGYPFDTESEDYLLHMTTGSHVAQICLFLLAESRKIPGRLIQTSPPARAGGSKGPQAEYRIIDLDLSNYDQIATRFHKEQKEGLSFLKAGIDTRNPAFNRMIEQIEKVAGASREPILLMGPTGAGKSRLAKKVFELKRQRRQVTGRFVEVNCATLRGDAAMSTLFGHKKGAFTGAAADRPGLLREADSGLLFLDEVAELGLDEQAMLLRAIEDRVFFPLGADTETKSDFQLICGTNKDLRQCVAAGTFREDLLARIDLWTFKLPGLADRREDVEPNLTFELQQYAAKSGMNVTFNREAHDRFMKFALSPEAKWLGNFRDLSGAIMRMATLAPAGRIGVPQVQEETARLAQAWQRPGSPSAHENQTLADMLSVEIDEEAIDLFDAVQLKSVLEVCRASTSLSDAGRKLFGVSREKRSSVNDADRLKKYLARFGVTWSDIRRSAS
jgi:transcriptional regulatory protein RtcR